MKTPTIKPPLQRSAEPDHFKEGWDFEQYVIQLFNKDRFLVDNYRESKKLEDYVQLHDCVNPDIELIFKRKQEYRFAVECKWRNGFIKGKIDWATHKQIKSYQDFQRRSRIPVFIVIGIGGKPSSPERLFVTPLCNIELHSEVYEVELIPYKRKPTRKFFYDTVQLKLF